MLLPFEKTCIFDIASIHFLLIQAKPPSNTMFFLRFGINQSQKWLLLLSAPMMAYFLSMVSS